MAYFSQKATVKPASVLSPGGELTEAYSVENGDVKMTKQELITMIENDGFEAVERDTVYNRVEKARA